MHKTFRKDDADLVKLYAFDIELRSCYVMFKSHKSGATNNLRWSSMFNKYY